MAVSTRKGIELLINRKVESFRDKNYSPTRLRFAARQMALKEIELIQKRTQRGLNKDGRKMRRLSDAYRKHKLEVIRNGWKTGRGRGKKRRLVSIGPTAFAANRAVDFMRLSGKLFSSMAVKALKVKDGVVSYTLYFKGARNSKIADYHINKGAGKGKVKRDFWGHVKTAKERAILKREFTRALK